MIIYKLTDRIPVQIGDLRFLISPLSSAQKLEIISQVKMSSGKEVHDYTKQALLSIKHGVKKVEGLKCFDGSEYELEFDESGSLTDDSVSELLQMEGSDKLIIVCSTLLNQIKEVNLEGVKVELDKVTNIKKK